MKYITVAEKVVESIEQLSLYWDEKGLDMHIAVKPGCDVNQGAIIAVSTKHWTRVHYLQTDLSPDQTWACLENTAKIISRTLIKSAKGPYVYLTKLNALQTQQILSHIRRSVRKISPASKEPITTRVWEISWEIEDAITPPPA